MMNADSAARHELTIEQNQWRKLFIDSIYQICRNVHPGIGLDKAAVDHIEELVILLLFDVLDGRPQTIADLEKRVKSTFPPSMCPWVIHEAEDVVHNFGGGKKLHKNSNIARPAMLPLVHKMMPMLREQLRHKIDEKFVFYLISILEYIISDILKWTGNYVKNIRKGDQTQKTIGLQNLQIALCADKGLMELMDMLYKGQDEQSIGIVAMENGDETQEQTYEKASTDLIREESQYLRELNLLVHVFRRRFESALGIDGKDKLESLFGGIVEIHELTVRLLRSLDDAIEMADSSYVGCSFWELCEGQDFDVYLGYIQDVFRSATSVDAKISSLLADQRLSRCFEMQGRTGSSSSQQGGNSFLLAVKYVLPMLLQAPVVHFYRYFEHLKVFIRLSDNDADVDDLKSSMSYFECLKAKIDNAISDISYLKKYVISEHNSRISPEAQRSYHRKMIQTIQKSIDGWEGKDIGYSCQEFIREGDLMKLRMRTSGIGASDTLRLGRPSTSATDRHVYLFDDLIVMCKAHTSKDKVEYKYKERLAIKKAEIYDLDDSDDLKNAFEIRYLRSDPNIVWTLYCKMPDEKRSWMSALVMLQTRSILDRALDGFLKEEEKRIPLILPHHDQYRFAEPDTDDNIVFEDYTSSSGIPVVRSGTVVKLVERLTYHLYTEHNFVRTFLTTYRSFCSPPELLALLIERFNIPTPSSLISITDSNITTGCNTPSYRNGGMTPVGGRFDTVHSPSLANHHHVVDAHPSSHTQQSFQRFRNEYMRPVQLRVISVLRQWVKNHWYDFERDPNLLQDLQTFLDSVQTKWAKCRKWVKSLKIVIDRYQRNAAAADIGDDDSGTISTAVTSPRPATTFGSPRPSIVWHTATPGDISNYDLLTLHPLEIGRQLTLLQSDLYRAVKPIELVGTAWNKADKHVRSPQLLNLMQQSTLLSYWIERTIVETPSLEERAAMFWRVIDIMCVFEDLNNFTGLVALYSALNSACIYRLKLCWERFDREKQASYDRFKNLCAPHWVEMIARLKSVNPPCVPFFGHYLSSILFFEEGNRTFISHPADEELTHDQDTNSDAMSVSFSSTSRQQPLVSFTKCRKIASIIADIQLFQNQPYALQVEPTIRQFFENIDPLSGFDSKETLETYLYDQSQKVEPKDIDKWEQVKPSRPPHVLKSPGIKIQKNHHHHLQQQYRSNANAAAAAKAVQPVVFPVLNAHHHINDESAARNPASPSKDNPFGIVDINPGHQPRYVRDVPTPTASNSTSSVATRSRLNRSPLRIRTNGGAIRGLSNTKAASTPPSPTLSSSSHSVASSFSTATPPLTAPTGAAPPLPPRRAPSPTPPQQPPRSITSTLRDKSNSPRTPVSPFMNTSTTNAYNTATNNSSAFEFPPSSSSTIRIRSTPTTNTQPNISPSSAINSMSPSSSDQQLTASSSARLPQALPMVPPRGRAGGDQLPAPLPPDAVNRVWNGATLVTLSASPPQSTSISNNFSSPPQLPPRHDQQQAPPRPPKRWQMSTAIGRDVRSLSECSGSSPPPLPPKTYKLRPK